MPALTPSYPLSPIALPGDFLRLGLRRGECNARAIRQALQDAVHRTVRSNHFDWKAFEAQLSLVALSGYRVLDPRYRQQLYERVQLSYPLERDDSQQDSPTLESLWSVPETAIDFTQVPDSQMTVDDPESIFEESSLHSAREVVDAIRRFESLTPSRPTLRNRLGTTLRRFFFRRAG